MKTLELKNTHAESISLLERRIIGLRKLVRETENSDHLKHYAKSMTSFGESINTLKLF